LQHAVQPSVSEAADAALVPTPEEEELLNPTQFSLFVEEEDDL
jgi:hypothetical protein